MNKLQNLMLMVAVAVMSSSAMAAEGGASSIDVTAAKEHITGLVDPITTIGTAMLGIFALILGFKLIKRFF